MPTISNKKEVIDHMEKSYDRHFKASYLLMARTGLAWLRPSVF